MLDRRLFKIMIALLACGLIAAGCGGDDEPSSDSGDASSSEESTSGDSSTSDTIDKAIQDCIDLAEGSGLEGSSKDAAVSACESTGDSAKGAADAAGIAAGDAAEQAKKTCLAIAKGIPDESSREVAIETCNDQFGG